MQDFRHKKNKKGGIPFPKTSRNVRSKPFNFKHSQAMTSKGKIKYEVNKMRRKPCTYEGSVDSS